MKNFDCLIPGAAGHPFILTVPAQGEIEIAGSGPRNDLQSYSICSFHSFFYRGFGSKGPHGWVVNTLYHTVNRFAVSVQKYTTVCNVMENMYFY
jgi:hypothetical protein